MIVRAKTQLQRDCWGVRHRSKPDVQPATERAFFDPPTRGVPQSLPSVVYNIPQKGLAPSARANRESSPQGQDNRQD